MNRSQRRTAQKSNAASQSRGNRLDVLEQMAYNRQLFDDCRAQKQSKVWLHHLESNSKPSAFESVSAAQCIVVVLGTYDVNYSHHFTVDATICQKNGCNSATIMVFRHAGGRSIWSREHPDMTSHSFGYVPSQHEVVIIEVDI